MASTLSFNFDQFSLLRHQTLNHHHHQTLNHHHHHAIKSNPFSPLKFLFNPTISHLKSNPLKPSTLLLKPSFLNPLFSTTPSHQQQTTVLCASTVWGHYLTGGGGAWAPSGLSPPSAPPPGRGDFRVWSSRRSGSKKKAKRLTVTIECTKCLKNRYTTSKNRFITDNTGYGNQKKKIQGNKTESLQLNKHCPKCNHHTIHKEIKK